MKDVKRKLNICSNAMNVAGVGFVVALCIAIICYLVGCVYEKEQTEAFAAAGFFAVIFVIGLIIAIDAFRVGLKCEKQLAFEATCQREIRDIYDELKEADQKNQKGSYVVKDRRGG